MNHPHGLVSESVVSICGSWLLLRFDFSAVFYSIEIDFGEGEHFALYPCLL